MDKDASMLSPAAANRPPWTWKVLLVGASIVAFGVSAMAWLGDDSSGLMPLRVMMVLAVPFVTVGGAFMAGQLRQSDRPK